MAYLSQTNKSLLEFSSADICNSIDNLADKLVVDLDTIVNTIYPVGSIYISTTNVNPSTFFNGVWESIGSGRCLMGVDANHAANTTAEAGLPNITGDFGIAYMTQGWAHTHGAFYTGGGAGNNDSVTDPKSSGYDYNYWFDASRSNPIYGNSSTVQPPAYYVYMWRRIG